MDDLFGGLFDFDGNGETDAVEAALGFQMMDELLDDEDNDPGDGFDDHW